MTYTNEMIAEKIIDRMSEDKFNEFLNIYLCKSNIESYIKLLNGINKNTSMPEDERKFCTLAANFILYEEITDVKTLLEKIEVNNITEQLRNTCETELFLKDITIDSTTDENFFNEKLYVRDYCRELFTVSKKNIIPYGSIENIKNSLSTFIDDDKNTDIKNLFDNLSLSPYFQFRVNDNDNELICAISNNIGCFSIILNAFNDNENFTKRHQYIQKTEITDRALYPDIFTFINEQKNISTALKAFMEGTLSRTNHYNLLHDD